MNISRMVVLAGLIFLGHNSSAISLKEHWSSYKKDNKHVSLAKAAFTGYLAYSYGSDAYTFGRLLFSKPKQGGNSYDRLPYLLDFAITGYGCYEALSQTLHDLRKGTDYVHIPQLPSTEQLTNKWREFGRRSRLAAGGKALTTGAAAFIIGISVSQLAEDFIEGLTIDSLEVDGKELNYRERLFFLLPYLWNAGLCTDLALRLGTQTWHDARFALTGRSSQPEGLEDRAAQETA